MTRRPLPEIVRHVEEHLDTDGELRLMVERGDLENEQTAIHNEAESIVNGLDNNFRDEGGCDCSVDEMARYLEYLFDTVR